MEPRSQTFFTLGLHWRGRKPKPATQSWAMGRAKTKTAPERIEILQERHEQRKSA